jgi:hypothetical protein
VNPPEDEPSGNVDSNVTICWLNCSGVRNCSGLGLKWAAWLGTSGVLLGASTSGVAEQVRQDFRERQPPFLADRRLRHEQAKRRRDRDAIDPRSHVKTLLRASYGCRAPVNRKRYPSP